MSDLIPSQRIPAAAYARFSSDHQREESIDAQLRAINEYAERNNYQIVETYTDKAISARSDQRPGFQQMIKDSQRGSFEVVIVHKLDRFSRDRYDSAFYRHELKKNGVTLRSVIESIDDSPESVILESVIEGMNEYYSKNLARETMKGLKENALTGRHTGGAAPFGYRINPETKRPEVNPDEADAIRMIFDLAAKGMPYARIADILNGKGYKTRLGNSFSSTSLHDLLSNPKYVGKCIYNKRVSQSKCNISRCYKDESEWIVRYDVYQPLVSEDEFEVVQRKLRARKLRSDSRSREVYLLTGKTRCAVCGGVFCGTRKRNGKGTVSFSYICNGCKKGCKNPSVSRSFIEGFVLDKLAEYVFSDKLIPAITAEYNNYLKKRNDYSDDRAERLISEKASLEKKISKATDILIETDSRALLSRLNLLEKRLEAVERELGYLKKNEQQSRVSEAELAVAFGEIRSSLKSGTLKTMKQLVDKYVQQVDIYPDKIVVKFNLFPHLRPDEPTNSDDQEGHSDEECPSVMSDDGPDSMTVDTGRAAFSTGDEQNYVKGMQILNRIRK